MKASSSPIYVVSGGAGASGEQLVHTVLAQFPESRVSVITLAHVNRMEQIESAVAQAATTGGIVVHTLVDAHLRDALIRLAQVRGAVLALPAVLRPAAAALGGAAACGPEHSRPPRAGDR